MVLCGKGEVELINLWTPCIQSGNKVDLGEPIGNKSESRLLIVASTLRVPTTRSRAKGSDNLQSGIDGLLLARADLRAANKVVGATSQKRDFAQLRVMDRTQKGI